MASCARPAAGRCDAVVERTFAYRTAKTRGDDDIKVFRQDLVTSLGRENAKDRPLWSQEGSRYALTADGRAAVVLMEQLDRLVAPQERPQERSQEDGQEAPSARASGKKRKASF